MTLLSVVQCVILSLVLVPFGAAVLESPSAAAVAVPFLLFVAVLWHKYVEHHQLLGWQLRSLDTYFVLLFAAIQAFGVVAALAAINCTNDCDATSYFMPMDSFGFVLCVIAGGILLGVAAYGYSGSQAASASVEEVVKRRFVGCSDCKNGASCAASAERIHKLMVGFEVRCIRSTLLTGVLLMLVCLGYFWLLGLLKMPSDALKLACGAADTLILLGFMASCDLGRYLRDAGCEASLGRSADRVLASPCKTCCLWWLAVVALGGPWCRGKQVVSGQE
jgi:uncharacterized metal-binding protein